MYYLLEGGIMIRWSGDVFLVGSFLVGKKIEFRTPLVGFRGGWKHLLLDEFLNFIPC